MTPEEITQKKALAKAQANQIVNLMKSVLAIQNELPEADCAELEVDLNKIICSIEIA